MPEKVTLRQVQVQEVPCRLDRWLKRFYPTLTQGMIQKFLREKQIKVNGKRAEASLMLDVGDEIRIPPFEEKKTEKKEGLSPKEIDLIQSMVIYKDDDVIVLNKPAGIAVQGGTGERTHIDRLLDGLTYGKGRPKLVHRLDKETSGVLVLGRTPKATAFLTESFKSKKTKKIYWALVDGELNPTFGEISAPLLKKSGKNGYEQVCVDEENGKVAETVYETESSNKGVSWVSLSPLTGRTHQLRVHMAHMGTPILGDEKYGSETFEKIREFSLPKRMYLHAVFLQIPHPTKKNLKIFAPIPEDLKNSFAFFGFHAKNKEETLYSFEKGTAL